MKKSGKATVIADNFEIISCQQHSGEQINWRKEEHIRDEIRREKNGFSILAEDVEFEDRLYAACDLMDSVKTEPWSNKKHIYSYQIWHSYELKVSYTYANRSYEATIEYETETGRLPEDCRLDITFRRSEPEKILFVSIHPVSLWEMILSLFS